MQRVLFRAFKDTGDIIAFFLDQPEGNGPPYCTSYMHVGQHGTGMYPHDQTRPASRSDYAPLLKELEAIGYDDLKVVQRGRVKRRLNHEH